MSIDQKKGRMADILLSSSSDVCCGTMKRNPYIPKAPGEYKKEFLSDFIDPPMMYRPFTFLSLNDRLNYDEVKRQMKMIPEKEMGGAFMHARTGRKSPYMGEEWLSAIRGAIDQSKDDGSLTWLYDEDTWPSGFAGHLVTKLGEDYHQKYLLREILTVGDDDIFEAKTRFTVGFYKIDGTTAARITKPEEVEKGDTVWHLYYECNAGYVDVLDKKVIAKFIEITHEKYKETFGKYFGNIIPGIFTDEPQHAVGHLPYSFELPAEFFRESGYDLIDVYPSMFEEEMNCKTSSGLTDAREIRFLFRKCVSRLFCEAFAKQIGDWCEENGIRSTGHIVAEDNVCDQLRCTAGAMPFYEYMQVPGIDWLMRGIGGILTAKQVTSSASQMGREFSITEAFGCTGWNISYEDLKWIGDYQYVLGLSMMCQHLAWYSMRGHRKRDYPPSLYYQQPWWDKYGAFNSHFGRLSSIISNCRNACQVMLVHPLHSAWMTYVKHEFSAIDRQLYNCMNAILTNHRDFDLADEIGISRYGSVAAEDGTPVFKVGYQTYSVVVLPEIYTLDTDTVKLLHEFMQRGGTVISCGAFPDRIDGKAIAEGSDAAKQLAYIDAHCFHAKAPDEMVDKINAAVPRQIAVQNKDGKEISNIFVRYMEATEDTQAVFAANYSEIETSDAVLTVDGEKDIYYLDTSTGDIYQFESECRNGKTSISYRFPAYGSLLILIVPVGRELPHLAPKGLYNNRINVLDKTNSETVTVLNKDWAYTCTDLNAITLDYCSFSVDGEAFSAPLPVLDLQNRLEAKRQPASVVQRFYVTVDEEADLSEMTDLRLVVEDAANFDYKINGQQYAFVDMGWWRDVCMRVSDISGLLQKGENIIELTTTYDPALDANEQNAKKSNELESIYLLGRFAVSSKGGFADKNSRMMFSDGVFSLTNLPDTLSSSSVVEQGMTFYAGNITLKSSFTVPNLENALKAGKRFAFDPIEKPNAVLYGIYINGQHVKDVAWAPYKVDITQYLQEGENQIEITLYGSCRNLFGPHHHVLGEPSGVGPSSFERTKGWIEDFLEDPNIWRDHYCFVPYGLKCQPEIISY